jgi:hypothetical protein
MRTLCSLSLMIACLASGACQTTSDQPTRTARVNHVVLFALIDSDDAPELLDDCRTLAGAIPGITTYYAGTPLDTGRETVIDDYHVGLYVGFDTVDAYRVYVDHPAHLDLVAKWRPRFESLRVYDIIDEMP